MQRYSRGIGRENGEVSRREQSGKPHLCGLLCNDEEGAVWLKTWYASE